MNAPDSLSPLPDMPSPFRTPQEREDDRLQKRQALLLAAVRMFNERGFHNSSLNDVAASLGVTKPLIYHYLGNKDQVLLECVRIGLEQLRETAASAAKLGGTGVERLKAFLRRYAEINMADFGKCVIRTGDESLSPKSRQEFRALKGQIDQALRKMIEDAAADGSAEVSDVRMTAFALAGALNWPARWYRADQALSSEAVAQQMVEILCQGLYPRR